MSRAKGDLREGSMIGFRIKQMDAEDELFLKFLEMQTNRAQTLRYLVEKEIAENGISDLAKSMPHTRDIKRLIIDKQGEEAYEELYNKVVEEDEEHIFSNRLTNIHEQLNRENEKLGNELKTFLSQMLSNESVELPTQQINKPESTEETNEEEKKESKEKSRILDEETNIESWENL